MVKRTELRSRADDRAFPVRVWLRADTSGLDRYLWDEAEAWLNREVGKGNWARHGSGWNMRLHMLTPEAAQRFVERFPHFQLRDLTDQVDHLRQMRRPPSPEPRPVQIDGAFGVQPPVRPPVQPARRPPAEMAPCRGVGNPPSTGSVSAQTSDLTRSDQTHRR